MNTPCQNCHGHDDVLWFPMTDGGDVPLCRVCHVCRLAGLDKRFRTRSRLGAKRRFEQQVIASATTQGATDET